LFEREHHRRVASVLESLDAGLLAANHCLFGGGTAIVLRNGEYRESVDIDLLVSSREGYRALRQRVTGGKGIQALARPGATLDKAREVRADQYGLRTMLRAADIEIKFEIVFEGRIALDPPGKDDHLCGVATLTRLDMAACKLLANSDRWADDAVYSRDLIDLAMMNPPRKLLRDAIVKARAAYGESIEQDLAAAIERLRARPHRLDDCMHALQMTPLPKALLWERIKVLNRRRRG
jgi:Nucleotidyl transferase AbiEii toxin, Type IV TA system